MTHDSERKEALMCAFSFSIRVSILPTVFYKGILADSYVLMYEAGKKRTSTCRIVLMQIANSHFCVKSSGML